MKITTIFKMNFSLLDHQLGVSAWICQKNIDEFKMSKNQLIMTRSLQILMKGKDEFSS